MRVSLSVALAMLLLTVTVAPAVGVGYPPRDARYHSYPEMVRHLRATADRYPGIVRIFTIGRSHQGRPLWVAEVSDQPGVDEGEPEVLFDGLHHAREHLSAEMAIGVLDLLTGHYGRETRLGRRVTTLVDTRRVWIVPMVNPDGLAWDLTGSPYRAWRKNRQPTPGAQAVGTDLNRNYGYRFGCCGASSGRPSSIYFRGPRPWSAPETRALRDFVLSRNEAGRQRIRAHITFHTAGELVLWPYGYTRADLPPDMTELDLRAFRALGRAMAATNGYVAKQSSAMYPTDGDMIDWMYGRQRIFSFTFELYPRGGGTPKQHYPPDEIIDRETRRNHEAVLLLVARAACPYAALGPVSARLNCGPYFDDLEIPRGWRADPDGSDDATGGRWQRGDPTPGTLQRGDAVSGSAVLVTGRQRAVDVDGGTTTIRSPLFRVPDDGVATLRLSWWLGHSAEADEEDGLRIHLVDADGARLATLLSVPGSGERRVPAWRGFATRLPEGLGGRRVAIELQARDAGTDTTLEAGVDQVRVTAD